MSRLELATPLRRTRRYERSAAGSRSTCAAPAGQPAHGGEPIRLARRRRRVVRRRLVVLCDISGSMEPYARAYLQFVAGACGAGPTAEAFAFATRLTRLTRASPRATPSAPSSAPPPRRRTGRAARGSATRSRPSTTATAAAGWRAEPVVVILSDGWERGDPQLLAREMERLGRLAHRIVWVNPRVAARDQRSRRRHAGSAAPLRCARERSQPGGARRGGRGDRGRPRPGPGPKRRLPKRRPGPAPRRSRAARWPCPAVTTRAAAGCTPGWAIGDDG